MDNSKHEKAREAEVLKKVPDLYGGIKTIPPKLQDLLTFIGKYEQYLPVSWHTSKKEESLLLKESTRTINVKRNRWDISSACADCIGDH